jgi:hypothetical protein
MSGASQRTTAVACGMAVAFRSAVIEREIDHPAIEQGCCQRLYRHCESGPSLGLNIRSAVDFCPTRPEEIQKANPPI